MIIMSNSIKRGELAINVLLDEGHLVKFREEKSKIQII